MPLSRFARWILIAAVALVVAAAAALLLVRQALDGGSLRSAAETRLTAMLGQPVTIGGLDVDVFPRAALTGTGIRVGSGSDSPAPAIQIARIVLVPRLWSLFSGPVMIDDVRLEGFAVSVLRDRNGGWHVPSAVPAPTAADDDGGLVVERVRVTGGRLIVFDALPGGEMRETSSIDEIEAVVTVGDSGLRLAGVTARIGGAQIAGEARTDAKAAHLAFTAEQIEDDDLPALLGLLGSTRPEFLRLHDTASASVALRIDRGTSRLSGTGTLHAPQVGFEPLRLQQLDAPFTIDGDRLVFDPTEFTLYDGRHRGAIRIDLSDTPARWNTDSRVTNLDLGEFLDALTASDARIDGTAAVTADVGGRLDESLAATTRGRVQLTVVDGVIRQFPLLATINTAVRLTQGNTQDTRFERLAATLQLSNGRATTDDLVLEAGHVRVEAEGTIGFDRTLSLHGTAVLSPERAAAAIRSVRELSGLRNSRGELEIPLTIAGTLDDPSFGVDLKAVIGKGLKDELMRRLRGIIKK